VAANTGKILERQMTGIIKSVLENDTYKFNMCANILRHHPGVPTEFRFNNRRPEGGFTEQYLKDFNNEIREMGELRTQDDEMDFIHQEMPWLRPHFLTFIKNFRYDPKQVEARLVGDELAVKFNGPQETNMMWEVPTMALISELFFNQCETSWKHGDWSGRYINRTINKAKILKDCALAEFGLRRRHSYDTQDMVVHTLKEHHDKFVGVSNVHMAMKHGLKPIGTMAHEMFMFYSVVRGLRHANRYVLEDWMETFKGEVGIALTDTFGTPAFFEDFIGVLARAFDGVRHDSANPFDFGESVVDHYRKTKIDPIGKSIVFSDGLNSELAADIERHFRGIIKTSFGIGTHLTNDFPECKALNMVIKLWSVNGVPVVKLSDVPGKQIGDPDALRVAKWTFNGEALD
jgi:nicotinate phosphoribosyltransferase